MILYPNSGLLWGAGILKTALVNSKIRLFKADGGIVLTPAITQAELVAAECDFTGYSAITVAAWNNPLLNPIGGAGIDSGLQQFATANPYTVGNSVGGGWVETAGGVLVAAWNYDPARSCNGAGDGVPVDLILIFG